MILVGFVGVALAAAGTRPVTLLWDYPPEEMNQVVFYVHHSTDPTVPVSAWPVIGSMAGTNRASISVVPGPNYFAVSASNFWGEVFSSVASTPILPRGDVLL